MHYHQHKGHVVTTVASLAHQQRSVEQAVAGNSYGHGGTKQLNFAPQTGNKIYHNTATV